MISAKPKKDAAGYPEEIVTVTGTAQPANSDQLDVFIAGANATCAQTAGEEDSRLAPNVGSAAYPINGVAANGQFDHVITFDPHDDPDGVATYGAHTVCGYLTEGGMYGVPGVTDTTAHAAFAVAPPPKPTGQIAIATSRRNVPTTGSVRISLRGWLTWTAVPARLVVYVDDGGCTLDDLGTPPLFAWVLDSARPFRRSATYRFPKSDYKGYFSVCAYLRKPKQGIYGRARAQLTYDGPPAPPPPPAPKPQPPIQLQQVENAVLQAAAEDYGGSLSDYNVFSCRPTGPATWNCIVDSYVIPNLGALQATVSEIDGHYYVGPFEPRP